MQIWFSEAHPDHIRARGDYFSLQNLMNWLNNGTHTRDIDYQFQYVHNLPADNEYSTESDSESTSYNDSDSSSDDEVLSNRRISRVFNINTIQHPETITYESGNLISRGRAC